MMCYQAREIVLMDLVCERVLGRHDYIFEEAWLGGGDVCEPASECQPCIILTRSRQIAPHTGTS
jgi:hypothetical protein